MRHATTAKSLSKDLHDGKNENAHHRFTDSELTKHAQHTGLGTMHARSSLQHATHEASYAPADHIASAGRAAPAGCTDAAETEEARAVEAAGRRLSQNLQAAASMFGEQELPRNHEVEL